MKKYLKDLLVISDIDGTLMPMGDTIPACNSDVIKLFTMLGGTFTFATGRGVSSTGNIMKTLGLSRPAIIYNGAAIYDYAQNETLYTRFLPKGEALRAMSDVRVTFPDIGILIMAENHRCYAVNISKMTYEHLISENYSFILTDEYNIKYRFFKILFICSKSDMQKLTKFLHSKNYEGVHLVSSSHCFFEILPEGATKGTALIELARILKKDIENTVMIGDYYNDIDALKKAGFAVVVEDAPAEVKAVADRVVISGRDGGLAEYLYDVIRNYT